jgi:cell division protein ZapA
MGQVALTLNGRTYRLACADGDEERFRIVAAYVKEKIDALAPEFAQMGEARLILMGAILIADELFEVTGGAPPGRAKDGANAHASDADGAGQGRQVEPGLAPRGA